MKQKLKASEYVLFAGIALLSLFYGLKTTVLSQDRDKLILLAADLLALGSALLRGRYSLKQLGTYGLFAALSLLYFAITKNYSILTICAFAVACVEADSDKTLNFLFWCEALFFGVFLVAGVMYSGNRIGMQLSVLQLLYIARRKGKLNPLEYAVWALADVMSALVFSSKAAGAIGLAVLLGTALLRVHGWRRVLSGWVITGIFPLCFLGNLFFAKCVGLRTVPVLGPYLPGAVNRAVLFVADKLDAAMSWRLSLTAQSLDYFGCALFGSTMDVDSLQLDANSFFYLDSGYFNLLQRWGVVFLVLFLGLMTLLMVYFRKQKRFDLTLCGVGLALWAINEPVLNMICENFLLLFAGKMALDLVGKKPAGAEKKRQCNG